MRKLVSLGLLALLFSMVSGPVFGGNVGACDFLKDKEADDYVPGLYGICVAWHNASANGDERALASLEERYARKSGGDPVPGSGPDVGQGDDLWFECPCFKALDREYICNLGAPVFHNLELYDPDNAELADVYRGIALFYGSSGGPTENFGIAPDLSECSHTMSGILISRETLNTSDGYICGFEIGVVAGLTEAEFCAP